MAKYPRVGDLAEGATRLNPYPHHPYTDGGKAARKMLLSDLVESLAWGREPVPPWMWFVAADGALDVPRLATAILEGGDYAFPMLEEQLLNAAPFQIWFYEQARNIWVQHNDEGGDFSDWQPNLVTAEMLASAFGSEPRLLQLGPWIWFVAAESDLDIALLRAVADLYTQPIRAETIRKLRDVHLALRRGAGRLTDSALEACGRAYTLWVKRDRTMLAPRSNPRRHKGREHGNSRSVPEQHRRAIAKRTLQMPDAMVGVMGGPTKAEARALLSGGVLDEIRDGVGRTLWVMAYADWAEEHPNDRRAHVARGGDDWFEVAPDGAAGARDVTEFLRALEAANDRGLRDLASDAASADGSGPDDFDAEAFGRDLALMALGTGASWFDDHAEFPLKVPSVEAHYDGRRFHMTVESKR